MYSFTEYFRRRLAQRNVRYLLTVNEPKLTGKKRKYEEAMGYANDYDLVQDYKIYCNVIKIAIK